MIGEAVFKDKLIKSPAVSIIMNCFNSAEYLREAIDSVYAQEYRDWEIIFWDNASTDNSAEIAKSYDDKLRYFKSENTVSIGRARNLAIEKAKGEYIAFLDCDDLWIPTKLNKQLPLFEQKARVGLVFCDTTLFDNKGKKYQLYKHKRPQTGQAFRQLLYKYYLSMETVVIRRAALDSLSEWFDERFNMIEEADLFTRLAYDWQVDYVPEQLAMWRIRPSSITFTKQHLFPLEREMQLEKYIRLYNNFEQIYSNEVNKIRAQVQYRYALLDWEKGDSYSVRRRLKPHLTVQKKYLIPYLMSIFPYRFYNCLLGCRSLGV